MNSDLLETKLDTNPISGGGNVDHGLESPDADIPTAKIRLAVAINKMLKKSNLVREYAAAALCLAKPKVSALQNYKLDKFSLMDLMSFANSLDYDVVIQFSPTASAERKGRVTVVAVHGASSANN